MTDPENNNMISFNIKYNSIITYPVSILAKHLIYQFNRKQSRIFKQFFQAIFDPEFVRFG